MPNHFCLMAECLGESHGPPTLRLSRRRFPTAHHALAWAAVNLGGEYASSGRTGFGWWVYDLEQQQALSALDPSTGLLLTAPYPEWN